MKCQGSDELAACIATLQELARSRGINAAELVARVAMSLAGDLAMLCLLTAQREVVRSNERARKAGGS